MHPRDSRPVGHNRNTRHTPKHRYALRAAGLSRVCALLLYAVHLSTSGTISDCCLRVLLLAYIVPLELWGPNTWELDY